MTEPVPETQPSVEAEAEQLPPRREPVFNMPGMVVAFIAICVIAHFVRLLRPRRAAELSGCCCMRRSSRSSTSGQLPVEFLSGGGAGHLFAAAWQHRASRRQHDLACRLRLAARQPHRTVALRALLDRHLDRRGRPALHRST